MYQRQWLFVNLCLVIMVLVIAKGNGVNVCTKEEKIPKTSYKIFRTSYCTSANECLGNNRKYRNTGKVITTFDIKPHKVCCEGYEGPIENCQPKCSKKCPENRYCSAPEKCDCKPGYMGDNCHAKCEKCGKFEDCQDSGECACIMGYKRINDIGDCVPECSKGCSEHSFCSEPEICQCEVGYAKSNASDICSPVCKVDCGNLKFCKYPDKCECFEGYELSEESCKPKCNEGCENGKCIAPEVCQCPEGYTEIPEGCDPVTTTESTSESSADSTTTEFTTSSISTETESAPAWMTSNTPSKFLSKAIQILMMMTILINLVGVYN